MFAEYIKKIYVVIWWLNTFDDFPSLGLHPNIPSGLKTEEVILNEERTTDEEKMKIIEGEHCQPLVYLPFYPGIRFYTSILL